MQEILLILLLQLIYVPTFTLRTIMLVKGRSGAASLLGFAEALIYVFGLSIVFSGEQTFITMFVYALGFGIGILIGTKIESELAIGYTTLQVILTNNNEALIEELRADGYGVTTFVGHGRDEPRYKLEILTKRNQEEGLYEVIQDYEPNAFIIAYEPKAFKGGFWVKSMKKRKKKKKVQEVINKDLKL
ncbi:DUF2179 domain-containing protein [Paenisporosarcina sp. TG20]|uniref:DUF2179 domain-containing protein n=1 Tax=Paenisporosarcina sp. TG20 TaxID=1211706 RepID=UPI00030345CF|nr:DUF2179 domain-containing protein [Paenisporosarcina sp. TG20]